MAFFFFFYFLGSVWSYLLMGGVLLFFKLLNLKGNVLSLLLVLEMIMLFNMLILFMMVISSSTSFCFLFAFLTCAVCESCVGISIMICGSREMGSDVLYLVK